MSLDGDRHSRGQCSIPESPRSALAQLRRHRRGRVRSRCCCSRLEARSAARRPAIPEEVPASLVSAHRRADLGAVQMLVLSAMQASA